MSDIRNLRVDVTYVRHLFYPPKPLLTIDRWGKSGILPPPKKVGNRDTWALGEAHDALHVPIPTEAEVEAEAERKKTKREERRVSSGG